MPNSQLHSAHVVAVHCAFRDQFVRILGFDLIDVVDQDKESRARPAHLAQSEHTEAPYYINILDLKSV